MPANDRDEMAMAISRVATSRRGKRRDNPDEYLTAKRELKTLKLERAIREAVEEAPPLTAEQRDRLAALLSSGGAR